jgi:hypothetical protein
MAIKHIVIIPSFSQYIGRVQLKYLQYNTLTSSRNALYKPYCPRTQYQLPVHRPSLIREIRSSAPTPDILLLAPFRILKTFRYRTFCIILAVWLEPSSMRILFGDSI